MNTIYTPYTYLIGWSTTKMFYYGSSSKRGAHPNKFWKKYFTSSTYVKEYIKLYGNPDIIQIRKTFLDAKSAIEWESKVLKRIKAKSRLDFLNRSDNLFPYYTVGKPLSEQHRSRIKESIKGKIILSDYQRSRIIESNRTRIITQETKDKMSKYPKNENVRKAVSLSNKTRVVSEETRRKYSEITTKRNIERGRLAKLQRMYDELFCALKEA